MFQKTFANTLKSAAYKLCAHRNYSVALPVKTDNLINLSVNEKTEIATLELNRPPVNSLNISLLQELSNVLDDVERNRLKGLIITSSSKNVFTAGLDITEMYKARTETVEMLWTLLQDVWLKLYAADFPTAAVINGHSPAGGCLLATCCEHRVMLPSFSIGFNETRVGIIAPKWCQASLRNIISPRIAENALTLGKMFSTEEALEVGLVDEVVATKAEALKRCEEFLLQSAQVPHEARAITKKTSRSKDLADLQNNREEDLEWFLSIVSQPKAQEIMGAYLENLKKR